MRSYTCIACSTLTVPVYLTMRIINLHNNTRLVSVLPVTMGKLNTADLRSGDLRVRTEMAPWTCTIYELGGPEYLTPPYRPSHRLYRYSLEARCISKQFQLSIIICGSYSGCYNASTFPLLTVDMLKYQICVA
jgi:hypothetical protein